jgi:hypothetical protein
MGYRLEKDEQLGAGFRRILIEQTERLSEALASADENLEEAIHEVRKRCKRVRAIARLLRPNARELHRREMPLSERLLGGCHHSAMLMSK